MSKARATCVVPDCFVPSVHGPECVDYTQCGGCAPGLAADGLLTCRHHRDRVVKQLEQLGPLYGQLGAQLAPYRSPQAPKGDGGRSTEAADFVNMAALDQRLKILTDLSKPAAYVAVEQALTMPRTNVDALTRFLTLHADDLCKDPVTAGSWGRRIDDLVDESRRLATRGRQDGIFLGECPVQRPVVAADGRAHREACGGPIRYQRDAEDPLWQIECPSCKTTETAEWWRQQIATDVADVRMLAAGPLAMRLSVKYVVQLRAIKKHIGDSTIRDWKRNGKLTGWVSTCDLATKRVTTLYDADEVDAHARKVYDLDPEREQSA